MYNTNKTDEIKTTKSTAFKLPTIAQLFDKKNRLFIIGLVGIVLIFMSDMLFFAPEDSESSENISAVYNMSSSDSEAYVDNLETELINMMLSVSGVGEAKVMITLDSPGETIYAQSEKSTTEITAAGSGNGADEKTSYESEYTIIDDGSKDTPIIEMQKLPEIRGVAVVCQGGDDISVIARVTELVSVVLGVPTNRIFVTKMV